MRRMTSIISGLLTFSGFLILLGIMSVIAFLVLLDWSLSARNLEKYHCVDHELMKANPYDKTPNFYGYHIIFGGDKRGFLLKKERWFTIVSAQYGEKLRGKAQLRPIAYDTAICSTASGESYRFTDYPFVPAELEVSWTTKGSERIESNVFQCDRYEDIHWHRYYNLQRDYPPLAPRDTSSEVRYCPK
jgi:hypothetical protein